METTAVLLDQLYGGGSCMQTCLCKCNMTTIRCEPTITPDHVHGLIFDNFDNVSLKIEMVSIMFV